MSCAPFVCFIVHTPHHEILQSLNMSLCIRDWIFRPSDLF
jgi:hypothetical protein